MPWHKPEALMSLPCFLCMICLKHLIQKELSLSGNMVYLKGQRRGIFHTGAIEREQVPEARSWQEKAQCCVVIFFPMYAFILITPTLFSQKSIMHAFICAIMCVRVCAHAHACMRTHTEVLITLA